MNKICDEQLMQCDCENCGCGNTITYLHHSNWEQPSNWACEDCLKSCYKKEVTK